MLGVAWAGTSETYSEFIDRHSITFPNIDDTEGVVYSRYGVPYQPAWVFIERDGTARTMRGSLDPSTVRAALAGLAAG